MTKSPKNDNTNLANSNNTIPKTNKTIIKSWITGMKKKSQLASATQPQNFNKTKAAKSQYKKKHPKKLPNPNKRR